MTTKLLADTAAVAVIKSPPFVGPNPRKSRSLPTVAFWEKYTELEGRLIPARQRRRCSMSTGGVAPGEPPCRRNTD
jgi:hypothetical protein